MLVLMINDPNITGETVVRPSGRDTQAEIGDSKARESHPRVGGHSEGESVAPVASAAPRGVARGTPGAVAPLAAPQPRRRRRHGARRSLNFYPLIMP